jgi:predicted dehydrogenase
MIRAGLCGYGGLGHLHANGLSRVKDVQLVAVCDKRPEQLKAKVVETNLGAAKPEFDIAAARTYTDFREMLAAEKLDVLVTALPTDLHAPYAILAMEAGCHVFSEKPMALRVEECDRMIAVRNRTRRQLMIGQCLRFFPAYEALRETVQDGRYGKLLSLSMERIGGYPRWSSENWFMDHRRSGGTILDLHLHDVDWVYYALGKPAAIQAAGRVGDTGGVDDVTSVWEYRNGPLVSFRSSWLYAGFTMSFRALFEKAVLEMGFAPDPGLFVHEHATGKRTKVELPDVSGYQLELEYFLDCVRGRQTNTKCSAESTRNSIRLVMLEKEAIRQKKRLAATGLRAQKKGTP